MDITVPYVFVTPARTITFNQTGLDRFNSYGPDEYYLSEDTDGLDGPPLRTPTDNRPQTHGGLVHTRLKGPRPITMVGVLLTRSTRMSNSSATMIRRNQMQSDLQDAIDSIMDADGTLTWTPSGLSQCQLTVRAHTPELKVAGVEWPIFTFGLIAANPDYI